MDAIRKAQFMFMGYRTFTKNNKQFPLIEGDMKGLNYVITGANSGIGLSAAKFAAERGAKVFLVCRNPDRGHDAVK